MAKKYPLEWHEECLRNSEESLARDLAEIARLQERASRLKTHNELARKRIEEARKNGVKEITSSWVVE